MRDYKSRSLPLSYPPTILFCNYQLSYSATFKEQCLPETISNIVDLAHPRVLATSICFIPAAIIPKTCLRSYSMNKIWQLEQDSNLHTVLKTDYIPLTAELLTISIPSYKGWLGWNRTSGVHINSMAQVPTLGTSQSNFQKNKRTY